MSQEQAAIDANRAEMLRQCGRVVLWTGVYTHEWTGAEWDMLGAFCQARGIDCVSVKVADGTIERLSPADTAKLREHFMATYGVGVIPFIYCYGPKFGAAQAGDEAALIVKYWQAGLPIMQADMEIEYNGQTQAATDFARTVEPAPGLLSISTWADPAQQDWEGVARILAPAANGWTPQVYTDLLSERVWTQYDPAIYTCMQPGLDLTQEFGANHQLDIVNTALAHGAKTFFLWEYLAAQREPALLETLVSHIKAHVALPAPAPAPGPTPTPEPAPAPTPEPAPEPEPTPAPAQEYRVVSGDTLWGIAERFYGDGSLFMLIYQANHTLIRNPDMIQTGWLLTIPPKPRAAGE